MEALKDLANANKEVLKSRTKNMVDQVDALKDRYENLEKRRKQEGEGYQADIHLLKQKLRHVEQQLVRAAVTRSKGKNHNILLYYFCPSIFFIVISFMVSEHDYIKKLKAYENEIETLRKNAKSNPQWID